MENLFSEIETQAKNSVAPLAVRMRPRTLDELVGQAQAVGPESWLRQAIENDNLSSVILFGPAGTGKTSIARVIAHSTKAAFVEVSAIGGTVSDLRREIKEAQSRLVSRGQRTILFIDEIHRFNRSQQDALLHAVEDRVVIMVGATTENPFFEVNKALVSRSRVFQLKKLTDDNLKEIAIQAIKDEERGYGKYKVEFEEGALEHLINVSGGDARSLLNALELAVETTPDHYPPAPGSRIYITKETAEESIQQKAVLYDKEGDYHFVVISAFIKSMRGSDPDAALYWLS